MAKTKTAKIEEEPVIENTGGEELVMLPGAKVRKPTEEEVLENVARQTDKTMSDMSISEEGAIREKLEKLITRIQALRDNQQIWGAFSALQRYSMVGAQVAAREILGVPDGTGKVPSLSRHLGFILGTGKTVALTA